MGNISWTFPPQLQIQLSIAGKVFMTLKQFFFKVKFILVKKYLPAICKSNLPPLSSTNFLLKFWKKNDSGILLV